MTPTLLVVGGGLLFIALLAFCRAARYIALLGIVAGGAYLGVVPEARERIVGRASSLIRERMGAAVPEGLYDQPADDAGADEEPGPGAYDDVDEETAAAIEDGVAPNTAGSKLVGILAGDANPVSKLMHIAAAALDGSRSSEATVAECQASALAAIEGD